MTTQKKITLVYDGACPFCSAYVHLLRLKDAFDEVILIDARHPHIPLNDVFNNGKVDLDQGMAVVLNGDIYHGDKAVNILALTATRSGLFNRAMAFLFSNPKVAKILYPVCKLFRRMALVMKGVKPL